MSKFILSAATRKELLEIWLRIAEDNIDAADGVVKDFDRAFETLADQPEMGHYRADVADPRYRFWTIYSYVIAYNPTTKPLQIVRVVHGARDLAKLFETL